MLLPWFGYTQPSFPFCLGHTSSPQDVKQPRDTAFYKLLVYWHKFCSPLESCLTLTSHAQFNTWVSLVTFKILYEIQLMKYCQDYNIKAKDIKIWGRVSKMCQKVNVSCQLRCPPSHHFCHSFPQQRKECEIICLAHKLGLITGTSWPPSCPYFSGWKRLSCLPSPD
jgi:hypothetical protein